MRKLFWVVVKLPLQLFIARFSQQETSMYVPVETSMKLKQLIYTEHTNKQRNKQRNKGERVSSKEELSAGGAGQTWRAT